MRPWRSDVCLGFLLVVAVCPSPALCSPIIGEDGKDLSKVKVVVNCDQTDDQLIKVERKVRPSTCVFCAACVFGLCCLWTLSPPHHRSRSSTTHSLLVLLPRRLLRTQGKHSQFELDQVFSPTSQQEDVFEAAKDVITSCIDGYNGACCGAVVVSRCCDVIV